MIKKITDSSGHKYVDSNNNIVPGVTTIINSVVDAFKGIPDKKLAIASKRGSAVHRACELDDMGILDESSLTVELINYLKQWRRWKSQQGVRILEIERKIYHKPYNYAGTYDRVGMLDQCYAVIDIKTGVESRSTALQLSAYCGALKLTTKYKNINFRLFSVYLKENKFNMIEYPNIMGEFLAFRKTYKWITGD